MQQRVVLRYSRLPQDSVDSPRIIEQDYLIRIDKSVMGGGNVPFQNGRAVVIPGSDLTCLTVAAAVQPCELGLGIFPAPHGNELCNASDVKFTYMLSDTCKYL